MNLFLGPSIFFHFIKFTVQRKSSLCLQNQLIYKKELQIFLLCILIKKFRWLSPFQRLHFLLSLKTSSNWEHLYVFGICGLLACLESEAVCHFVALATFSIFFLWMCSQVIHSMLNFWLDLSIVIITSINFNFPFIEPCSYFKHLYNFLFFSLLFHSLDA